MSKSKIEWTDEVWNPVTGCSKVSEGCTHCYAEREWARLAGNPMTSYYGRKFNDVACHPERLDQPLRWKKPRKIFVNSMSDLFHEDVPDEFLDEVFASIAKASQHTFLILTKRPKRMHNYILKAMCDEDCNYDGLYAALDELGIPDANPMENIWLGVSVENQASADERIPLLLQTPASVRFISAEPLLSDINVSRYLKWPICKHWSQDGDPNIYGKYHWEKQSLIGAGWKGIDWVIVGGESGPRARPMHPDWVRSLRDQCQAAGTKFFFKQWGEFKEYRRYNSWPKYRDSVGLTTRIIDSTKSGRSSLLNADASDLVNGGPEHKVYPISHLQRVGKKKAGRELDGRTWDELPEVQT